MRNYFLLILFSTVIFSCEEKYKNQPKVTSLNTIVVDAILTNENISQCIKISKPLDSLNANPVAVSRAMVSVNDGSQNFIFNESDTMPGSYFSLPFQIVVGKTYNLTIEYNSVTYNANAFAIPLSLTDSFEIIPDNNLFKYVEKNIGDPCMIKITYDWSLVQDFSPLQGKSFSTEFFYVLKNMDINKEIGPAKEVIDFPKGTKITRKIYSLSEQHQAFLRSLLLETDWRGGIFDVQQGNVISNISNGGLGYFAACTVAIDSLIVK
jgi:hypothetical protein